MVKLGKFNKLTVNKQVEYGFYLQGDAHWGDILLPKKYVPKGLKLNDEIEVFVYIDSEDTIVATTQKPYATVGEFAVLKVKSVENIGVFLDWGLEKDLFVPYREMLYDMHPGQSYIVYIYVDSSERIAASTRVVKFIDKSPAPFSEGQKVELLPYQFTNLGVNALINGSHLGFSHSGLIFKDEIISNLKLGEKIFGYIKKIRDDNKIDLSLQPEGTEGRVELADQIIAKLKEVGGSLDITAKTPADTIHAMFGVSRNKFKIALGYLYKKKLISIDENSISLK